MARITNRELWSALALWGDPLVAGVRPPRARRRNAHPEQGVLNAVMQALRLHPKVAWRARMNSGAYKTPDGRFVRFGFPGCPDVIGQLRDGRILMLEIKSDGGRLTDEQRCMLELCCANNGVAGIVRNLEEMFAIIDKG